MDVGGLVGDRNPGGGKAFGGELADHRSTWSGLTGVVTGLEGRGLGFLWAGGGGGV